MQFESATKGNITMQIWLEKQYLGQRDNLDQRVNADVQIRADSSKLDDTELARLKRLMDKACSQTISSADRGLPARRSPRPETKRSMLLSRIGQLMAKYDFLLLPVTQVPAFDIKQEYVTEIEGTKMESYIDWMRSCIFISVTALPAISVPAGLTPEGLPVGYRLWDGIRMTGAFSKWRMLSSR